MNEAPSSPPRGHWLRIVGTAIVCLAILAGSAAAIVVIERTEPTAQQVNATRRSAALVETLPVTRGTFSPRLVVLGTVQAAQDIVLGPRVSGQVVELSPNFLPGGMVHQGQPLLRIDPADFENAVSIRESELRQAEASLEIEQGRQSLAKKELALLEGTIDQTNRALVLREPQIASIRAEVSAAQASLERAKLDLQRSSVFAPFDAQILSRSVNLGSQVAPGDELARLVGVDQYWVMAAVPVRSLQWVKFPDPDTDSNNNIEFVNDSRGSRVTLRNPDAWPVGTERTGFVSRMIGTVDQQSRLARVLITVDDPLGQQSDVPPLILDSLIETEIEGRPIQDVVRLPREFVRESDTVWVMSDGKLQIRQMDVVFRDAQYAYVRQGLDDGDQVVTTTLATVAEGVELRAVDPTSAPSQNSDEETAD